MTCAAIIATASGTTGLILPGMMLLPGCSAGRVISARPASRATVHPAQIVGHLHQDDRENLEISRQFDGRVLRGYRREIIAARDEVARGARREQPRECPAERGPRIEARADRRAALRQRQQPRPRRAQALAAGVELRLPAAEFLAHRQRHGVHQVRAAGLDDGAKRGHPRAENRADMRDAPAGGARRARARRRRGSRVGITSLLLCAMFT